MENPTRYVVKREAGCCEFVPPPFFGRSMAGMFGAGSVYLVYLSTTFFRRTATAIFGAILLLIAALPAGLGIRAWRARRTPLTIERGGRVTYGERELCAAGTVRAVRIARLRGDEAFDYEVCLELDEGRLGVDTAPVFRRIPDGRAGPSLRCGTRGGAGRSSQRALQIAPGV